MPAPKAQLARLKRRAAFIYRQVSAGRSQRSVARACRLTPARVCVILAKCRRAVAAGITTPDDPWPDPLPPGRKPRTPDADPFD